jgi:hypothetical protein
MQDLLQLNITDPDVAELFDGVSTGGKVKITLDVTVSEIDDERFIATVDEVHDDIGFEGEEELEDEEDYEEEEEFDDEDEGDVEGEDDGEEEY